MAWYFTSHALKRMSLRGIKKAWILRAIADHDTAIPCSGRPDVWKYYAHLKDGRRIVVWVDKKKRVVISAAWPGEG